MELVISQEHKYRYDENSGIGGKPVYKAFDENLKRYVLLKIVTIQGDNPKDIKENFNHAMGEVRTLVKLEEQRLNIPVIYNTFQKENNLFIVMQWIDGYTLDEWVKKASKPQIIKCIVALCNILVAMERVKINHLDIKPENIIVRDNTLYLIDFNISRELPRNNQGTVGYCAPEMTDKLKVVDRSRSDVFSIGVVLYEIYTGARPESGVDYSQGGLLRRGDGRNWKKFIEPKKKDGSVDETINDIIVKCMKLSPKDRYGIRELQYALNNYAKSLGRNVQNGRKR